MARPLASTSDTKPLFAKLNASDNAEVKSRARQLGALWSDPSAMDLTLKLVRDASADTGTLGIYSTGTVAHVLIQRPLTRDEATSEALSDVDYMFDGLNQHPNMFVALPAAVVATPISLWKQSAALVHGLSPRTIREADAKLSKAANETRPHQELAVQVAQQLAPQTSQPVMLVRQPLPPGAEACVACR